MIKKRSSEFFRQQRSPTVHPLFFRPPTCTSFLGARLGTTYLTVLSLRQNRRRIFSGIIRSRTWTKANSTSVARTKRMQNARACF